MPCTMANIYASQPAECFWPNANTNELHPNFVLVAVVSETSLISAQQQPSPRHIKCLVPTSVSPSIARFTVARYTNATTITQATNGTAVYTRVPGTDIPRNAKISQRDTRATDAGCSFMFVAPPIAENPPHVQIRQGQSRSRAISRKTLKPSFLPTASC